MNQQTQEQPAESPAEIYEHHMVPAIFAPWVPALLDLAAPQLGEHLLDVACGTGVVAREAVSQVGPRGRVVGLDINPNMLNMARAREPSVEWREGNAEALPFANREFDMVVCQQGLQFFPNRGVALREMHRVLVPGAASHWLYGVRSTAAQVTMPSPKGLNGTLVPKRRRSCMPSFVWETLRPFTHY